MRHILFWISMHFLVAKSDCQECNTAENWIEYNDKCYYVSTEHKTWNKAYEYCRQEGGHLTSVLCRDEMDFLYNTTVEIGDISDAWLGAHDLANRNASFQWTDGSDMQWTDWAPSMPDPDTQEYCMYMHLHTGICYFTREVGISKIEGVVDNPRFPPEGCVHLRYFNDGPDEDNIEVSEEECENDLVCDVYTYMSRSHSIYAWRGEAVGCNFATSGENTLDEFATSGQEECGEPGEDLWHTANCGMSKNFVCSKGKDSDIPLEPTPTTPIPGHCPEGYLDVGHKCFKIVNMGASDGVTREEARILCKQQSGRFPDLASVGNTVETAVLVASIQDYAYGVWISLHKVGDSWLWLDNSDTEFTNWSPDSPGSNDCVEFLATPPGTWSDLQCSEKRGYICEIYKDAENPLPPPPTTPHNCPTGYIPYWYACYKLGTDSRNWTSAERECVQDGGHLVSILSAAENSALWYFIQNSENSFPVWIGFKQNQNDDFQWSDGWWVRYTNWNTDHPGDNTQSCAIMDSNGKWSTSSCSEQYATICKTTTAPVVTTPADIPGICPGEWVAYGNFCYHIEETSKETWVTANSKCQEAAPEYDANLASLHDHVTNQNLAEQLEGQAWIGLRKADQGEPYIWTDGSTSNFSRWAPDEPEDSRESCVLMESRSGQFPGTWIGTNCYQQYGYICQATKKSLPTTPTSPTTPSLPAEVEGNCPNEEWEQYGEWCFLFKPDETSTWDSAESTCSSFGGHLASIHESTENWFVWTRLQETYFLSSSSVWIGMYRLDSDDDYLWPDGTDVVFQNWSPDHEGSENCVMMTLADGKWIDSHCTTMLGYVCKTEIQREMTTTEETVPTDDIEDPGDGGDGGLSGGAIVGIIIGVVAIIAIVGGLCYKKKKSSDKDDRRNNTERQAVSFNSNDAKIEGDGDELDTNC